MMNKTYEKGIYIHIPFCVHKCIYCDFLSAPAGDAVKYAYTKALINEIRNTADGQVKDKITSIFFGGGTPSVLPDGCIADILAAVRDCFDVLDDAEITMECNPGTVNESRLSEYRAAGVNRLSFGLQSADNNELKNIMDNFKEVISKCKSLGFEVEEVTFGKELLEAIYPVYNVISCAEATSNNSNLTGIPFGSRVEAGNVYDIMVKTRTEGFSELIKRRFVIGSYVLQKENQEKLFLNASRVRRLIVDRMNELFKEYDGLIMPTSGDIAPLFDKASDKLSDEYLILGNHLVIGNFGGFPSISIPSGFVNNMPVSINITGRAREDYLVLNVANKIEEVLGCKGMVAKDE